MINIPNKCRFIFEKLQASGFDCYAVGGCVRDSIMNIVPKDWDFTTNATPDEISAIFNDYKLVDIGKKYGTICVVNENDAFEITTFRTDGDYTDNRHPDSVCFSADIRDDLSRRDFTMNSIAYSESTGFVDVYSGFEDIKNRLIRCTGEPVLRFGEDALRILRALRFASVSGFEIETETSKAIFECKDNLKSVHPHRMRKELSGLLMGKYAANILRDYAQVLSVIIPEIVPMFDCAQNNPHHKYDVWNHTLKALENSPQDEVLRLSIFFHDIGKPHTKSTDDKGIDHFKSHQLKSMEIAQSVLRRYGYPTKVVTEVSLLVRYHDERFRRQDESIKRVLSLIGKDLIFSLLTISECDMLGQSEYKRQEKLSNLESVRISTDRILGSDECYTVSQMKINGEDLIRLGYSGKEIGIILDELLYKIIKGKLNNEYSDLISAAKLIDPTSLKIDK